LGFSRKLLENEVTGTRVGTPLMQSPEILFGRMYDHGADVWALGCIYYELVTGFPPFLAKSIPMLF
jgi:serine/threonine protein kinase